VDYLDPTAFALPATGEFGNLAKGLLRGPNLMIWDTGIFKNVPIRERWKVQFRAEFFNVLNRVNLNDLINPTTNTVSSGGFGSIRGAGDPRIGQLL